MISGVSYQGQRSQTFNGVSKRNRMSAMKKTQRKVIPVLVRLVIFASVLGITTSCGNSSPTASKPPASKSALAKLSREVKALLADGGGDTTADYFQPTSSGLVAAAAGDDNSRFYELGKLLVSDGLGNTIIDLGREMNAGWYEWSEQRAPSSDPDAYILAWRQIVKTMRTVPGQHFKFLWTLYPDDTSVADSWPGSAYVDYIGTDIFDWYGGAGNTYPHTASGALDHEKKWQEILTTAVGGLDWMAKFSKATGKPIIIPEWGLDFHTFGGKDDLLFIRNMMAWLKAHDAIGLYWAGDHVSPVSAPSGPLLANQGESAQNNTVGEVNAMGALLGGRMQYAGVYLPDSLKLSDSTDQPVLAPWENTGYQLILSVPIDPLPPAIKSYSGPQEPGDKPYQLADYPDAIAAIKQGL
jgi:Glycosyl hydrolase family 26